MVKKLLKYEFIYYIRSLGLFLPIVLAMAVMTKLLQLFGTENIINSLALSSSVALLFMSCAALLVLGSIFCVLRFYKNMYSAEGYLTFTLPVTNAQHIFAKLLPALVCEAVCLVTVIAAALIALPRESIAELLLILRDIMGDFLSTFGVWHTIGYLLEGLVIAVVSAASGFLLIYACITIGQLAKKNRILLAIGAYFIYYTANQIITTLFTMLVTMIGMTGALDGIALWIIANIYASLHIYLVGVALVQAALGAVFWLVTQKIMTKKLNLE